MGLPQTSVPSDGSSKRPLADLSQDGVTDQRSSVFSQPKGLTEEKNFPELSSKVYARAVI